MNKLLPLLAFSILLLVPVGIQNAFAANFPITLVNCIPSQASGNSINIIQGDTVTFDDPLTQSSIRHPGIAPFFQLVGPVGGNPDGEIPVQFNTVGTIEIDCNDTSGVVTTPFTVHVLSSGQMIGGEIIPIDSTAMLLAGVQTYSTWILPLLVSMIGIGIVIVRRR